MILFSEFFSHFKILNTYLCHDLKSICCSLLETSYICPVRWSRTGSSVGSLVDYMVLGTLDA